MTHPSFADKFEQARALFQQGNLAGASEQFREIIKLEPNHFDALNLLGVLSAQTGDLRSAIIYFNRAIAVQPRNSAPFCNLGMALQQLNDLDAALESFDHAISNDERNMVAHFCRGNILRDRGQSENALSAYSKAIAVNPDFAQAHFNSAVVWQQMQQLDRALEAYDRCIEINPDYAEAYGNKAFVLHQLQRNVAALAAYEKSIALNPGNSLPYVHRGNVLTKLGRSQQALASYDQAISLNEKFPEAHCCRGALLETLGEFDAALRSLDRALALKPDYPEGYFNRAVLYRQVGQLELALADYKSAAALAPELDFLPGALLESMLLACDWTDIDAATTELASRIDRGQAASPPFGLMTLIDSPRLQRKAAEIWVRESFPLDESLGPISKCASHRKIRVGYFSADFRDHPVLRLVTELIETHDRTRFEIFAFSFGPDTHSKVRTRLVQAFDRFIDVKTKTNAEIATLARSLDIDIAIDLGGYTLHARPGIFALRAAPVQISYLGYLGTMGAPYMDYMIADPVIVPSEQRKHYSEKILYIPSYQVNDSQRQVAARTFTRRELGIPSQGFVFACFNSHYKITPGTFASWMRILQRVPGSVLFVYSDSEVAKKNLRKETEAHGVDKARVIFGDRLSVEEYLARFKTMDLFLDTAPYNAGTTASDALWAGLPVLTRIGDSFAARVAASLLTAIDLPELITVNVQQYEDRAVELASNPRLLLEIRTKLDRNRLSKPLFDTRLFAARLEAGYEAVYQRQQADLPPADVSIN